jgi:acylphosphatase
MIRCRLIVHGLVQGVFFRESTRRKAISHGVQGWAHNRLDGTVEAVFEGERDAVEQLVGFCHEGPRGAIVERVERFDEPVEGLSGFSIC